VRRGRLTHQGGAQHIAPGTPGAIDYLTHPFVYGAAIAHFLRAGDGAIERNPVADTTAEPQAALPRAHDIVFLKTRSDFIDNGLYVQRGVARLIAGPSAHPLARPGVEGCLRVPTQGFER